jgi:hypothetical protein
MFNQPLVVDATFTATGEFGAVEALAPLVASVWEYWQAPYIAWHESDTKDVPPFHCERREPSEWRLTASGVLARRDLAEGRASVVFDFVLRRGFFSGAPHLMPEGRISHRGPVRGHGRLVKFEKVKPEAVPSGVKIMNWPEGATALSEAFAKMYETLHANGKLPPNATAVSNSKAPVSSAGERRDGRNLETETHRALCRCIASRKLPRPGGFLSPKARRRPRRRIRSASSPRRVPTGPSRPIRPTGLRWPARTS